MNDALIQTDEVEEVEAVEETSSVAEVATEYNLDDIQKTHYSSAKLSEAQEYLDKVDAIAGAHGLKMQYNFNTDEDFPAGYGVAIVPIAKRLQNENRVIGVAIAAIPDLATVAEHSDGNTFIENAVYGNMIAKLANAVRPRGESGESAASIPFSVDDFITSNRPEGVLLAFRNYAGAYVKVLKKKGLKFITESILRQALQSAAFAEQQFPAIGQDKWVAILDSMVARASADKLATGILEEWKANRDSAELPTGDVDLSDLDFDNI